MIAALREKKHNEVNTVLLINKAIDTTYDYIVNLYFERAHVYQLSYMAERDKLEKGDNRIFKYSLKKMEEYIHETERYIMQNNLKRWFHRLYRFWGKISEYKGNYHKAVGYYKKSLKHWRTDPEVVSKGVPRGLELEGFLASAMIMSEEVEKGMQYAKKVYKKYETTSEGKKLRNKDYTTWAIWRAGVPIFVARGLIEKKIIFKKEKMLDWLNDAEKLLNPPKSIKTWADFQFRKDELAALKKLIC
jgi:hypothetical protein